MQQSFAVILIVEGGTEAIDLARLASVLEYSTASEAIASGLSGADYEVESVRLRLDPKESCESCGEPADEQLNGKWYCSACIEEARDELADDAMCDGYEEE